jgi:hypothetical protein
LRTKWRFPAGYTVTDARRQLRSAAEAGATEAGAAAAAAQEAAAPRAVQHSDVLPRGDGGALVLMRWRQLQGSSTGGARVSYVITAPVDISGKTNRNVCPFSYSNDHFTKAGSGQTKEKLKTRTVFLVDTVSDDAFLDSLVDNLNEQGYGKRSFLSNV